MTTQSQAFDAEAFHVYDTTLRDGTQMAGMALTVRDKLSVARLLDEVGVGFIEGGWPGANPKDAEFFRRAKTELSLQRATLTAFGATRRAGLVAADDPQVAALRDAETAVITLVAKSDRRHVEQVLRTTPEENLAMVRDTVAHLVAEGRRVFLDAEHFFDGYRYDSDYALAVVAAAADAGAGVVVLCDTNGGMLPSELTDVVGTVAGVTGARLGIHCHNDTGCAVANSLAAIDAGVSHVQGTVNGYGERCGNADLFTLIANLEVKQHRDVLPGGRLPELQRVAHAVSEVANIPPDPQAPYVGAAAFTHKAGLHAQAIKIAPELYQHMDPEDVGNDMRLLVSELAGRATVEMIGARVGLDVDKQAAGAVVQKVKDLEAVGYAFEAAEASFELLLRAEISGGTPIRFFTTDSWSVSVERTGSGSVASVASVTVTAAGRTRSASGTGNGPVNALDTALRAALTDAYPSLRHMELVDYKVRIVDGTHGTAAVTRVIIQAGDGEREWSTVGVDENVVAASWRALDDSYTYGLIHAGENPIDQ